MFTIVAASEADTTTKIELDQIEKELIDEAYARSKWMIRASHILIEADTNDAEDQNRRALEKIAMIRKSIKNGTSFSHAARAHSDSPTVNEDDGDLGFFTVFEQFYPIETAAFTLQPGALSDPIKSRFGYHLLTVTDRILKQREKRVAHILIEDLTAEGKAKANAIFRQAANQDFAKLVATYSDDATTRRTGGDLGFDRLVDPLEEVRLHLPFEQISKPVKTTRGWHLLKVTAEAKETSLDEKYDALRQKIYLDNRPQRILNAIEQKTTFYPIARALQ